jgi:hypothetical protein
MRGPSALLLLAIFTACGPRFYVAPTGNPVDLSRITVRSTSALDLWPRLYDEPLRCAYTLQLSKPARPVAPGRSQAIVAARGVPVTVGGLYSRYWKGGTRGCAANATFVPVEESYTVTFDADELLENGCRVVVRVGQGSEGRVLAPPKLVVRGYSQAFVEASGWCPAMTEAQRAGLGLGPAGDHPPTSPTPPSNR